MQKVVGLDFNLYFLEKWWHDKKTMHNVKVQIINKLLITKTNWYDKQKSKQVNHEKVFQIIAYVDCNSF